MNVVCLYVWVKNYLWSVCMFLLFQSLLNKFNKSILWIPIANDCLKRPLLLVNLTFLKCSHSKESTLLIILECPLGKYGNDCSKQCSTNCDVTSRCDRFTGECDGGCKPGWTGIICDQGKCFTIPQMHKRMRNYEYPYFFINVCI